MKVDLTVIAIPGYIGAMAAEYRWQKKNPAPAGSRAADYELNDTMASLAMGLGSLVAPFVSKALLDPLTPRGRFGRATAVAIVGAGLTATVIDVARRHRRGELPEAGQVATPVAPIETGPVTADADTVTVAAPTEPPAPLPPVLDRIGRGAAVAALGTAVLTVATELTARTAAERVFARSRFDLGSKPAALAVAVLGWDFIYYWNHRLSHEVRWLWAVHSVHHSSERYNLSTALRQPWGDSFALLIPYSLLALVGVRPATILDARALNLIYQFWIHTEAVKTIGPAERVLNTPSHHRAHHAVNAEYLDRNHGSILILWDKLFGTFEPEVAQPIYGLTENIDTFNPVKVFAAEWVSIAKDVAASDSWRDRISFLFRGPGWAYRRRAELRGAAAAAA